MVGALAALRDVHGIDPRECDVIVGTSAGSVLAALLGAGVSVDQLVSHQRGHPLTEGPLAGFSFDYEKATGPSRPQRPKLLGPGSAKLIGASLRRVGRMPPTAMLSGFLPTGTGSLARVGHLVEAVTPMGRMVAPRQRLDRGHGLRRRAPGGVRSAGCPASPSPTPSWRRVPSSWFAPVRIDGREYVDGGTWSATNADLVAGHDLDEVYVLAPMVSYHLDRPTTLLTRLERRWRLQVTKRCLKEADKVRADGAQVTVVGPGPDDLEAMGGNVMDLPRRIRVLETSLRTSVDSRGSGRTWAPIT